MIIGLDGILLRKQNAGSLRYFQQLLLALMTNDSRIGQGLDTNLFRIFADESIFEETLSGFQKSARTGASNFQFKHVQPKSFIPGALQQQLFRNWDHPSRTVNQSNPLNGALHQQNLDLLHSPVFIPPLAFPGKTVMTVYDLTFLLYPETQKWTGRFWWRLLARPGFRKADKIITISDSTCNDLVNYFKVPIEKVRTIHLFPLSHFRPVVNARQVASHYGLPDKYILFVGTIEPRKNIPFLLKAYHLAQKRAGVSLPLVIVGKRGWMFTDVFKTVEELGITHQVKFLDYLPDIDLPAIYTAAQLFVFLSKYEGFGIPPLEAMACGVPVIVSNTSSLPEVVGDAGILVPPNDLEQAAEAILQVLQDEGLQRHLSAAGIQRAHQFSVNRFRDETLAVYHSLISK